MKSITPLTIIQQAGSSTSDGAGKGRDYQPKKGQIFKAMVLEAKGNNTFLLDIKGNKVPAHAKSPLQIGQTLQLRVEATTPQLEMRIISDSKNLFAGKNLTLLGDKIDIQQLLATLRTAPTQTLDRLSSTSRQTFDSFLSLTKNSLAGKDGGGLLKQLVERLGMSLENLLAKGQSAKAQNTLKAALLELSHAFKGADKLSDATNKLLNTLELYQHAQLQLEHEDLLIFPLPIPFLEKGYLLIEKQNSEDDEATQEEHKFSLHLSLEGLGHLQIDVAQSDDGIFLTFISQSKEKLQFIQAAADEGLKESLGAQLLGVSYHLSPVDPASDLLKKLIPRGDSLVNTRV